MDQQPTILEVTKHARTAEWYQLGVQLGLDSVALAGCRDCISMYHLWFLEKAREATRRNLLNALRAITQNVASYEDYLKTLVSHIVYISLCICIYN